jgi:hypothetical protein
VDLKQIGCYAVLWTGFIWLRIGASGWLCEHGIASLVSIKIGNFLTERLLILKIFSVPRG